MVQVKLKPKKAFQVAEGIKKDELQLIAQKLVSNSEDISRISTSTKKISSNLSVNVKKQVETSLIAKQCTGELTEILDKEVGAANICLNDLKRLMERVEESFKRTEEFEIIIKDVAKSTAVINKVANKTEVLAMNAGILAAQAGKFGKGFNVLSKEIKKLANLCQDSANTIADSVAKSLKDVQKMAKENHKIQTHANKKTEEIFSILSRILGIYEPQNQNQTSIKKIISLIDSIEDDSKQIDGICLSVGAISEKLATQSESTNKIVSDVIGTINGVKIIDLSPKEALMRLREFQIIDVRRQEEFDGELGHISGSSLITIGDEFADKLVDLPKNSSYLFVCRSGGRSARAARIAQINGFTNVFNLGGGMLAWNHEGLPVLKKSQAMQLDASSF